MGPIAKEAGLSRQALYLTFADRADLFVALLRYVDGKRGLVQNWPPSARRRRPWRRWRWSSTCRPA